VFVLEKVEIIRQLKRGGKSMCIKIQLIVVYCFDLLEEQRGTFI
jgi:hypothetical protein